MVPTLHGGGSPSPSPTHVELVAKSGSKGFADEAALAAAQKDALKLGNVVRCAGSWSKGGEAPDFWFFVFCLSSSHLPSISL